MLIIDSKTIQNADTAKEKCYDEGKKSGVKIHIAVDVLSFSYAVYANTANVTDRDSAVQMFSE